MSATGTLRIQRSLSFQAGAAQILDAWCDRKVQAVILEGAAECIGEEDGASIWHLRTRHGRPMRIRAVLEARGRRSARHRAEGDNGLMVHSELAVSDGSGNGVEATLAVSFQAAALPALMAAYVDPAPVLLAGQALRRLRACVEDAGAAAPTQASPTPADDPADPADH